MKRWALSAILIAASCGSPPAASAAIYEPEPQPFCQEEVVHDHLAPLRRLPKLHSPPENGRIGFGSPDLTLRPYSPLVVGEGTVGYSLALRFGGSPVHPSWNVTTTVSKVNREGGVTEVLKRSQRHVSTISRGNGAGIKFEVDGDPAVYRITIVFRNRVDRKLGGYGFYARVVAPTENARLGLSAGSYRPGQTVFGRVENFGTTITAYGIAYSIERLEGSQWALAPESPRGPVIAIGLSSPPGKTGAWGCNGFHIPAGMPFGRYRMAKDVTFAAPGSQAPIRPERTLTAEFDVLP